MTSTALYVKVTGEIPVMLILLVCHIQYSVEVLVLLGGHCIIQVNCCITWRTLYNTGRLLYYLEDTV